MGNKGKIQEIVTSTNLPRICANISTVVTTSFPLTLTVVGIGYIDGSN
jgi:hypothetical protein